MSRGTLFSTIIFCLGMTVLAIALWQKSASLTAKPSPSTTSELTNPSGDALPLVTSANQVHFEHSSRCALCHGFSELASALRDSQKNSVAPVDLWQTSMMAQSSRDPYWRAVVSAEIQATPNAKAHIEELCTRCHTPMAAPITTSPQGEILAFLKSDKPQSRLGLDGVSCTVCHQITADNLGQPESFTGGFVLNRESKIYGPHPSPVTMPMQRNVQFTPTHSPHILQSALCATCHTVITDAANPDGSPAASGFHEQAPYLEWRNSIFNDEIESPPASARSCQNCHLPTTDQQGDAIATRLAHNPGGRDFPFLNDRQPFGRHTLIGGNALMTRIMRDNASTLGVTFPAEQFDTALGEIQRFLRQQTGSLELGQIRQQGNVLEIPVTIHNLAGHKLPTAYPSRRVWIELSVTDSAGNKFFHSGGFNAQGELIDARGAVLASELAGGALLPHFQRVDSAEQVQVYESIMADAVGQPTFLLVRGAGFFKDNRLLPQGWSADHPDIGAILPAGIGGDDNFFGGSDQLVYHIPIDGLAPYQVTASLHYQVITPRHAAELFAATTVETEQFRQMYERANRKPELIDTQSVTYR